MHGPRKIVTALVLMCGPVQAHGGEPGAQGGNADREAWRRYCLPRYEAWAQQAGLKLEPSAQQGIAQCDLAYDYSPYRDNNAGFERFLRETIASRAKAAGTFVDSALPWLSAPRPDPRPRLLSVPNLEDYYPTKVVKRNAKEITLKSSQEGRAIARCTLDARGIAGGCSIVSSSGSAALNAATLRAVGDMRWEPAAPGARPRIIDVPIDWRLR